MQICITKFCNRDAKKPHFTKEQRYRSLNEKKDARVHFIPNLKNGVFVTLCAPTVINSSIPCAVMENKDGKV